LSFLETNRDRRECPHVSSARLREEQHLNCWEGTQIVSTVILLIGIGFVALLTGSFAQRFLARPGAASGARARDRADG
jgi:hypothetical protein